MRPLNINRMDRGCRGLCHVVSRWAETTTSLRSTNFLPAVSLFQDFREMASRISHRRSRPRRAQLEAHVLFAKNRETAQQQPISQTKTVGCLFRLLLKQHETMCNSQHIVRAA
jgi:hypothetical protein